MGWGGDRRRRGLAQAQWTSPVSATLLRRYHMLLLSSAPPQAAYIPPSFSTSPSVAGSGYLTAQSELCIWLAEKKLTDMATINNVKMGDERHTWCGIKKSTPVLDMITIPAICFIQSPWLVPTWLWMIRRMWPSRSLACWGMTEVQIGLSGWPSGPQHHQRDM